ncbi:uncharacterized protein LAESUDRAFT_742134 [Laetiporus sulphureus 93-53]|uniref:TIGR04076 family protein n=1 Tax=Laetiporus sulphureus 93-53 TaxID=1314785 RepID=A0A165FRQ1_9APHY|nr:uncharacterized protein LAESUDRAFT_742134 [Laetiporus sulphureus 93-53]KZT09329.1 hypothetical protein LAESUDRAFT_742134 [Laetiporus sulphureus 93-53]
MTTDGANRIDDSFQLYDLRVEVVCPPGKRIMCGAKDGDYFILEGEMLKLPPGQGISIYSLCAITLNQRVTSPNDWISTDAEVACPDPNCPSRLRIIRTSIRTYKHGDVTIVSLRDKENESKNSAS